MVDSFIGTPNGPRRDDILVVEAGIRTGGLVVSCPECGETNNHAFECTAFDGQSDCQFTCSSCDEVFTESADTVWAGALIDLYDRCYD